MLSTGLSVSRLVSVSVSLTTPAITAPAINALLILGSSNVIGSAERMRAYGSISDVGADFLTSSPEFQSADMWFSQAPSPEVVYIGRWFKTPAAGQLVGRPLTGTEQTIATWNAIVAGGFSVTIDALPIIHVTGLTFAAAGNLNAVAAAIQANASITGKATVVWDSANARFVMTSVTTGIASAVSFLTAPTAGTDISAMLGMTAADAASGAFSGPGVATESALTALTVIDGLFSTQFYGVVCPEGVAADHLALANYCEAADPPHYYGVTTGDPLTLTAEPPSTPGTPGSLANQLAALGYNHTAVQFSTSNPYAISSYLARILTTAWTGSNTTIDLMYKREPGVAPEQLNATQANRLADKSCNVYAAYANGATMIQHGVSCSGVYTDTIVGADAMAGDVQAAIFNTMYTSATKVPQTDAGMSLLFTAATSICNQYARNGYIGDGIWTSQGFGTLNAGDHLPGFYVFAPSILTQSTADRAARKAPLIQIAAKTAGAIESADISIFVNQ
jgi:hypothetical protein